VPDSYNVSSTSRWTAKVGDIWLNPPQDADSALTRRILRVELLDNRSNPQASVKACILHQRRSSKNSPWQDADHFNLARLPGGHEVRLQLGSSETLHLFDELTRLYALSAEGIARGEDRFVVAREDEVVQVAGRARQIVEELLREDSDEIWNALEEIQPDLFKAALVNKLHQVREAAVQEFGEQLNRDEWSESNWQEFFEQNTWIFGYGLSYRFLTTIETQPHFGGTNVTGRGAQRGDFLAVTEAEKRFTVLVEIKKPSATLVADEPYRNQAHLIGAHLAGGVAQLQVNCRTWEISGSREEQTAERLRGSDAHTLGPKGILVIGHTRQLDSIGKRGTFELFRRNMHNPEIITFDELLERSKHLLLNERRRISQEAGTGADSDAPF
jgi:hypothetical protein